MLSSNMEEPSTETAPDRPAKAALPLVQKKRGTTCGWTESVRTTFGNLGQSVFVGIFTTGNQHSRVSSEVQDFAHPQYHNSLCGKRRGELLFEMKGKGTNASKTSKNITLSMKDAI